MMLFYKTKAQTWDNKTIEWNEQGHFRAIETNRDSQRAPL